MYLSLGMQVFESGEEFTADDGDVRFAEARGFGFELGNESSQR